MRLHLVTGHKGQAHITAEDHGALNAGILGDLEAILNIGEKFRASAIDANTVRIYDGELIMQGRHVRIARGEYEDVDIDNGTQGMKRNDLIVVRYTKDPIGVETAEFAVLKGTETTGTPVDPTPTTGDILSETCLLHEMPLYRVRLNGINVEAIELLAGVMMTEKEYRESILQVEKGGTGADLSSIPKCAIVIKSGISNNLGYTPTGDGAFYATSENGNAIFGTLPIEQGGTGAKNAKDAVRNLGLVPELERIAANEKAIKEKLPLTGGELTGNLKIGPAIIYASNGQCANLKINRMWHFGDNVEVAVINKISGTYGLCPSSDNEKYLGGSSTRWKQLYAGTTTINTSDRNQKRDITDLADKYIELFDLIRPVSYYMKNGDRIHTGFIAQEVEEAMVQVGLTAEELGFFCRDILTEPVYDDAGEWIGNKEVYDESGNPVYIYGLRYSEYIAITAAKVKVLEKRIEKLEAMMAD